MQASKGAVRQAGKELSKEDKQKARETAQMEKQASKGGKKRARDDSKPAKAGGKSDPAAKKYALHAFPSHIIMMGDVHQTKMPCILRREKSCMAWQALAIGMAHRPSSLSPSHL